MFILSYWKGKLDLSQRIAALQAVALDQTTPLPYMVEYSGNDPESNELASAVESIIPHIAI